MTDTPIPEIDTKSKFLWAEDLRDAISLVNIVREPLIEHLIYKKSAHMIYAPDGIGKSTVALQICMQSTIDNARVFGEFHVPRALRILDLQMERDPDETLERLKTMSASTGFNPDNFVLSAWLQGLDIVDKADYREALARVQTLLDFSFALPDIVFIDPINALVGNDMISNKDIAPIRNFSSELQRKYGCTILCVHHANRGQRDESGKRQHQDMFGSRFLSAHFTGIYNLKPLPDDEGTVLTLEKSSQKNLEKKIELAFDIQSHLSWIRYPSGQVSKKDKLYAFFRACKSTKKTFTIDEMMSVSGMSHGTLRNILYDIQKDTLKTVGKTNTGKNLYEYTGL